MFEKAARDPEKPLPLKLPLPPLKPPLLLWNDLGKLLFLALEVFLGVKMEFNVTQEGSTGQKTFDCCSLEVGDRRSESKI